MDFRDEIECAIGPFRESPRTTLNPLLLQVLCRVERLHAHIMARLLLGFFWYLLHLLASIMEMGSHLIQVLAYYLISSGILKKYRKVDLHKLQYLAVVVDSEEARNTTQIKKLLHWLSDTGVKYVILYDMEGLLKKSLKTDRSCLTNSGNKSFFDIDSKQMIPHIHYEKMTVELLSSYDGKEAAAKAASFICSNYLKDDTGNRNSKIEPTITEADMTAALKAVGYEGPEPNLLLVYGPARCHLGFPAWRMRYTEIVHMGPLKSMKYGAILKVMHEFSNKHQNYGT